jgi:KRAB domain-containing zinc finger protein
MVVHACPDCAYTTSVKTNFKSHLRTHTGEKPYACNKCGKCFSQQSHLSVHVRIHSDDKEFACDQCSYRTSRKDHLKLHISRHGQYPVVKTADACAHCTVKHTQPDAAVTDVKVC